MLFSNVYAKNDAGVTAAFTRSGWAGARYIAIGKAAEVVADDVYSIYWNPAGLRELMHKKSLSPEEIQEKARSGKINSITEKDLTKFSEDEYSRFFVQVGISTAFLDLDREAGFAGAAFNLFNGVFGVGYYGIQSINIEARDEQGNKTGSLNYMASAGYLSYAWPMGVASLGVSFKGLNEKIGNVNYWGMGSDIGGQIEIMPLVKIGFIVQDIGTWLKPVSGDPDIDKKYNFTLPVFKLSASVSSRDSDIIASVSGIKKLEQDNYEVNFGIQYSIIKNISIYLGLNNSDFSSGLSVKLSGFDVAYAFTFDRIDSGYNNIVSLTMVF